MREIVDMAFAFIPHRLKAHHPSEKNYNYETLIGDIIKYRTAIYKKESL